MSFLSTISNTLRNMLGGNNQSQQQVSPAIKNRVNAAKDKARSFAYQQLGRTLPGGNLLPSKLSEKAGFQAKEFMAESFLRPIGRALMRTNLEANKALERQGLPRYDESIGRTLGVEVGQGGKSYIPKGRAAKEVLGTEEFEGFQQAGQNTAEFFGTKKQLPKGLAVGIGAIGGTLEVLPDATDVVKAARGIQRSKIVKEIAASKSIEEILPRVKSLLTRASDADAISIAKDLVNVTSDVQADDLLKTAEKRIEAVDYMKERANLRKLAEEGDKKALKQRVDEFFREFKTKLFDRTGVLSESIRKYNPQIADKIERQLNKSQRYVDVARSFMKDKGFDEIVQSLQPEELDELENFVRARHEIDLDTRGFQNSASFDYEKATNLVDAFKDKYTGLADTITKYSQDLLDYAVDSGLVSADTAKALKAEYPNYIPMDRVFSSLEESKMSTRAARGKGGVASKSGQNVVRNLTGSQRETQNVFETLLDRTYSIVREAEINKAANTVVDGYMSLPGNPFNIVPLRTAEDVNARMSIWSELKALRPLQARIQRIIKARGAELNRLQRELKKLNIKGLKIATKKQTTKPTKVVGGTVESVPFTKTKIVDEIPKDWNSFKNSLDTRAKLEKNFPFPEDLALDFAIEPITTRNKLKSLGISADEIKKLEKQLPVEATKKQFTEFFDVTTGTVIPQKNTREFIEQLITLPKRELHMVRKKIALRDAKLATLIDDVMGWKDALKGIDAQRAGLLDEASLLADIKPELGDGTISRMKDGVKEIYRVPNYLEAAAKNMTPQQFNVFQKVFSYPTRLLKAGTTGLRLAFALPNFAVDQIFGFITSPAAVQSLYNPVTLWKALSNSVGGGKIYDEMVRSGAMSTSFDALRDMNNIKKLGAVRAQKGFKSKIQYAINNPGEALNIIEDIISTTERFTRIQQFIATERTMLRRGLSPEDAKTTALLAAENSTVNFLRSGEWTRQLNMLIPYLSASFGGTKSYLKAMKERPIETMAKTTATLTLPAVALTAYNLSDPKRAAIYNEIADYEKENNFIIIKDDAYIDEGGTLRNVIKVKIPPGVGNFANIAREFTENIVANDPINGKQMIDLVVNTLSPLPITDPKKLLGQMTPQAIKPAIQSVANYDFFTESPIVPEYLKKLDKDLQVKQNTSGTVEIFANLLNLSPIKTEKFLKDTFGSISDEIFNLSDKALVKLGVLEEDDIGGRSTWDAIRGRFTTARATESRSEAYDIASEIQQKYSSESKRLNLIAQKEDARLQKLTPAEAGREYQKILKEDPELAKQIVKIVEKRKKKEKESSVSDVADAIGTISTNKGKAEYIDLMIKKKYQTPQERGAYYQELVKAGVITKGIADEIIKRNKK